MGPGRVFLITLIFAGGLTEKVEIKDDSITIHNLNVRTEKDALKLHQYSNYTKIYLQDPIISNLSIELLQPMRALTNINSMRGSMDILQIAPQLTTLIIYHCEISSIIIDTTKEHKLRVLFLANIDLTKPPKNLNHLKNLVELRLMWNKIQHINMNDFNGLHKLKYFDLGGNKITQINSPLNTPVNLPSLRDLELDNNKLSQINFADWSAVPVEVIDLSNNRLASVQSLQSLSWTLNKLKLDGNPVDCRWKNAISAAIPALSIETPSKNCSEYRKPQDSVDLDTEEEIFQIRLSQSPVIRRQEFKLQQLEKQINECLAKIDQLQHANNEPTESFNIDIRRSED